MKVVNLGNGYIAVKSRRAQALLDKLIDEDKLWSYLSYLFNQSADKPANKQEPPNDLSIEEMKNMMTEMLSKVSSMEKDMQNMRVVTKAEKEAVATATVSSKPQEPKKVTKHKPKKKAKPANPLNGNLMALASMTNFSDRK